jgi:MFS family permease
MRWPLPDDWLAVSNPRKVTLISGAHAMNEFFSIALPPVLPLLVAEFSIDYAAAGFLLTIFFATYSICQLPAGMLADRIGKRPLIAASTIGLVVGTLVASRATSYSTLVVAQILAGVSGSAYHPSGMSLISDIESGDTEGRAMGIHGFGGIAGIALAPVVVGGVSSQYTWRLALVAAGVVGIVFTAAFVFLFPRRQSDSARDSPGPETSETQDPETSDATGQDTSETQDPETSDATGQDTSETQDPETSDATGQDTSDPASERLWRRVRAGIETLRSGRMARVFVVLFLLHALISAEIRATHSFTTVFAYSRTGESTAVANVVFLALLVGSAIASLSTGRIADSVDRRWLGAGASGATAVLFVLTGAVPSRLPVLVGWFFLIGIVMYVQAPVMNAMTADVSSPSSSGSLFGVMATAGALGSAAAPAVFGVVATVASDRVAFQFIGVLGIVVTVVFLAFPPAEL